MSSSYDAAGEGAVFEGFWIDHHRGNIKGSTLTLRSSHAVVLLAFLAVLVTFAATRSWLFWRFLLHSFVSRKAAEDASAPARLRHEVILRNTGTPSGALWSLLSTASPKQDTRKDLQRGFFLGSFTAIHVLAFAAASILTSQVIVGQIVVSRVTDTCGLWSTDFLGGNMTDEQYYLSLELDRNATVDADNYVRNCHSNRATSRQVMSCNKLLTRELEFYTETGAECPFQDNVCLSGHSPFVMDSGNITLGDLGINSKFAKYLTVRRRSTCTPMDSEIFRVQPPPELAANALIDFSAFNFFKFPNGSAWDVGMQIVRHPNVSIDYDLQAFEILMDRAIDKDDTEPVEPLQKGRDNHTASLILLSGTGISFSSPNDDPLFSANRKVGSGSTARYKVDKKTNMIGCDERAQFCSSLTGRCTTWGGPPTNFPDALSVLGGGGVNEADGLDIVRSTTLVKTFLVSTLLPRNIGERTAAAALQAGRYLYNGQQQRLELDQWKRELEYWFAVGLARLQLEIFGTVEKPPGVNASLAVNMWDLDEFKGLKRLCGGVKFKSPGHTSLSTLGFGLVLGMSGLLILLSFADIVVPWLLRRRGYEFREWEQTDMLKLLERTLREWSWDTTVADPFQVHPTGPEKGVMPSPVTP